MADKKKTQKRKSAPRKKRRIKGGKEMTLAELFRKRKEKDLAEFKPDATTATWG